MCEFGCLCSTAMPKDRGGGGRAGREGWMEDSLGSLSGPFWLHNNNMAAFINSFITPLEVGKGYFPTITTTHPPPRSSHFSESNTQQMLPCVLIFTEINLIEPSGTYFWLNTHERFKAGLGSWWTGGGRSFSSQHSSKRLCSPNRNSSGFPQKYLRCFGWGEDTWIECGPSVPINPER